MRKTLSNGLIIVGALIILIAFAGNYYTKFRQQKMIEAWMNDVYLTEEVENDILEGFNRAQYALLEIMEYETSELIDAIHEEDSTAPSSNVELSPTAIPAPTKKPLMPRSEIEKKMLGMVIIDKIDVKLPVLTGVDEETLRVAAGRMPQTGMPDEIGNMVLAGHRSYSFGKYFNRLDELEIGDEIIIQTKTKKLRYVVYKTLIVEPDDFSILNRNNTDKVLTLFTCHPVAIASHRLVVHAVQVN